MAIICYTGVMGTGKTYEGVSTAALEALKQGRRVVTNIRGFNYEAIRDYLGQLDDGTQLEIEKVVVVNTERITQPNFFYDPAVKVESIVQPGDLVLIDEVWEFWGADAALLPEHKKFFRMHRHYTETDSSISCDLVIMIQDLTSLNRFIKSVLETNYKFTKLKTLGWSTGYRVEVYEGNRQTKKNLVSVFIKKYDKNIFPLYQSYASGKGKEAVVDDRQNIFKNKFFVGLMILAIVVLFSSSVWFVKYIGKMRNPDVKQQQHDATQDLKQSSTSTVSTSQPVKLSSDLKMVGYLVRSDGQVIVFVQNSDGRVVRNEMKGGIIDGFGTVAGVEGKMVGFSWESNTSSKVKK